MELAVRPATRADAEYIGTHLRKEDVAEIVKAGEKDLAGAVMQSFLWSDECNTYTIDGTPALIFGACGSLLGTAKVWALGTDECKRTGRYMVKRGRRIAEDYRKRYGRLENWCDADYAASLRWLRMLGFNVEDPENGFCHIVMEG